MSRNKSRLGKDQGAKSSDPVATPSFGSDGPLIFETPSEFVDLPSKGRYYAEGHPLHDQDCVEIKHMTAKEEDILSSRALLKKGVAIDRFLQSIIKDKDINVNDLLVGDKNAILIAARISGYGEDYTTQVTCPGCMTSNKFTFDLSDREIITGEDASSHGATETDRGTFITNLPNLGVDVELRLLTGKQESFLTRLSQTKSNNSVDTSLTDLLRMIIISVTDRTDSATIESLVDHLPARDSRHIREVYGKISPNIDLKQKFECSSCSYTDVMEVPLNAEFFWPK